MIDIKELRITEDGKYLIVEAEIEDSHCYKDVEITSVTYCTLKEYTNNGVGDKILYDSRIEDIRCCKKTLAGPLVKGVRIIVPAEELKANVNSDLIFIYITTNGMIDLSAPCINDTRMCVVAYLKPYYKHLVKLLGEIDDECNFPKGLIDSLLRLKSLELNLKLGNYDEAIKLWNKWFSDVKTHKTKPKRCGCHGHP